MSHRERTTVRGALLAFLGAIALMARLAPRAHASDFDFTIDPETIPCGDYRSVPAVVWHGNDPHMDFRRLAAYCAPVLWFSPDEPLLDGASGQDIKIPTPFPFETPSSDPVVYYRVREVLERRGATTAPYEPDARGRDESVIDLSQVAGIDLDFFFYYPSEAGLGGHQHDVESAQFQIVIWTRDECPTSKYQIVVSKVIGKAHGLQWYDNTLGIDEYAQFPMHLLVEEGKHATCTDKNGDGYYTPNYDVNRRVNDAWAIRDVIRGGTLFTGGYASWMTKVRKPEHRVFPPLPEDSPRRAEYVRGGAYAAGHSVYALRPFPSADAAPPDLVPFIADKGDPNWPTVTASGGASDFSRWVGSEPFVKSLSIALYLDGDVGISGVFPLLIVKNVEAPMVGGFLTNRVVLKDTNLRDGAWMLHYTPSASRWLDTYLSAGVAWDHEVKTVEGGGEVRTSRSDFVFETGLKFRVNMTHSPAKFLTKVTDFWGFRAGIKNIGFWDIDQLTYVIEIGAGTW
ncbi:MAG: hypothetical protein ACREOU_09795 [Candidatus Eiseniibacteriota bacterium]